MQRETRNSSACLKAQCEPSNDVSFTLTRRRRTTGLMQPYQVSIVFSFIYAHQRAPDGMTGLARPYWFKISNFPIPSHLAPSIRVTPFEFMEKLYGS